MRADGELERARAVTMKHVRRPFTRAQHAIDENIDLLERIVDPLAAKVERVRFDAHRYVAVGDIELALLLVAFGQRLLFVDRPGCPFVTELVEAHQEFESAGCDADLPLVRWLDHFRAEPEPRNRDARADRELAFAGRLGGFGSLRPGDGVEWASDRDLFGRVVDRALDFSELRFVARRTLEPFASGFQLGARFAHGNEQGLPFATEFFALFVAGGGAFVFGQLAKLARFFGIGLGARPGFFELFAFAIQASHQLFALEGAFGQERLSSAHDRFADAVPLRDR